MESVPVAIESISHDRYGIMLHDGRYPTVTASDWLEFRQTMETIIAIETAESERIQSNIAAIEEIHALVASMQRPRSVVRNDDDFASKSDDINSEMDWEYVEEYDDRYTSCLLYTSPSPRDS